jgi:hypothetical protein
MARNFAPPIAPKAPKAPMPSGFRSTGLMGAGSVLPRAAGVPKPVTVQSTGVKMPKVKPVTL